MDNDEGLTTKLWLEEREVHNKSPHHYRIAKFKLGKHCHQLIEQAIKQKRFTWNTLIHSAWGLLLNRFSSADYIVYGHATLTSNRANVLKIKPHITPIKSCLNEKITLKAFINKTGLQLRKKEATKVNVPDELRYLLLSHTTKKITKQKKSHAASVAVDANRHPLTLLINTHDFSTLNFYYSHAFLADGIHNLFSHLELILESLCGSLAQKAALFNLLTKEEHKKILNDWNCPRYPFDVPVLSNCIHDLFMEHSINMPDNVAIGHNEVEITYSVLNDASSWLASNLIESGIKSGDKICVLMDRSPTLIMTMLAIFKTGAVYVPINPKFPEERINFVLNDTQTKTIIVNNPEKLPEQYRQQAIVIDATWENLTYTKKHEPISLPFVDPGQMAYIIYTSGTTGNPKGVMVRHKSLVNLVAWYRGCFNITHTSQASQFSSQGFDTFLCETIPFLGSGACIHIVDDHIKLTPSLFFSWIKDKRITICDLPTAYAQILFTMPWPENIHLKTMKIGGETVTHQPPQSFTFDIWNGYGPTETTIEATFTKFYEAHSKHNPDKIHTSPPIGKPISNFEAYVVDKYLQPVPVGVGGELLIGGVGVAIGYLNRNDLTTKCFISHIFQKDSTEKLYRTGDLVRWRHDGYLEYISRIDNQVKIRGYRIELGDIEHSLHDHPDVSEAVVLAKEGLNGEKTLTAYVVPDLDNIRYLYQVRCILSLNKNEYLEALTEDISKNGLALSGISTPIDIGHKIEISLTLPGMNESKTLSGYIIWQQDNRCGIVFDLNDHERTMVSKSIEYYLSIHNVMSLVLSSTAKRSLRKALKKKLPEYMIPTSFVTLMQMPLTFSGKIDTKALPPPHEFEKTLQKKHTPPKTETEKSLAKIWEKLLHKTDVSITDNFFDLGGSSLSAAEFTVIILNQFHVSVPAKILFDLPYIPIIAEFIDSKGKKYSAHSMIQDEIQRDCKLQENITPTKTLSLDLNKPQNILLTGAGGFLGVFILKELLEKTDAKIYCLIRSGEFESAAKRLISTIQKFNLQDKISLSNRRIITIASDISFDNFGLPLEQYNNLLSKIDVIYHCGAQVSIMASYNNLRASNVQGTIEVIKFATKYVDKPIHYISTLSSAYKKDAAGRLIEAYPNETYEELFGGYAISKWVSEYLLTQAKARGLPISIYRSGYIFGESSTGITNLNDALLMLIKGCIQLGYAPAMKERITILPVDFVSKAIVSISQLTPDKSGVFHIDHPTGIMWTDLVAWLNHYGYKIHLIPIREWLDKLVKIPRDNSLYPFIPYYLAIKSDQQHSPDVDVTHASAALKKNGIDYPEINDALLKIYMLYLHEAGFLPAPYNVLSRT